MPLLKSQSATPAIKQAVVLDLGDLGAQAAKLRMAAEARAQQILADAEKQASQLLEDTRKQGFDQGLADGLEQGIKQGQERGQADAFTKWSGALQKVTDAWADVSSQWDRQRIELHRDARQAVLRFALKMGEKLTHRVVEVDESVIVDQVANALEHVLEPMEVTVRVNPVDRETLAESLPQITASFEHLQHVRLIEDNQVGPGGCVANFGEGRVDATIEVQVQRLVDQILPVDEEDIAETVEDTGPADPPAEPPSTGS